MRLTKPVLAVAALALVALPTVGASAAATATEPAKAYGGCVSKSTGYLRVLERNNLAKSSAGACKSTERRITLPSVTGVPALPTKLVFRKPAGTDSCTKVTAQSTSATWTFSCTFTPAPSPSPSPAS
ncbi:hypothetical protein ACWEN6_24950 [Sphaerisporangium sp. NPDC004334]